MNNCVIYSVMFVTNKNDFLICLIPSCMLYIAAIMLYYNWSSSILEQVLGWFRGTELVC